MTYKIYSLSIFVLAILASASAVILDAIFFGGSRND